MSQEYCLIYKKVTDHFCEIVLSLINTEMCSMSQRLTEKAQPGGCHLRSPVPLFLSTNPILKLLTPQPFSCGCRTQANNSGYVYICGYLAADRTLKFGES